MKRVVVFTISLLTNFFLVNSFTLAEDFSLQLFDIELISSPPSSSSPSKYIFSHKRNYDFYSPQVESENIRFSYIPGNGFWNTQSKMLLLINGNKILAKTFMEDMESYIRYMENIMISLQSGKSSKLLISPGEEEGYEDILVLNINDEYRINNYNESVKLIDVKIIENVYELKFRSSSSDSFDMNFNPIIIRAKNIKTLLQELKLPNDIL